MVDAATLAQALRGDSSTSHRLDLDFAGCRIRVQTNEPMLRSRLADYYRHFVADAAPIPDVVVTAIQAPTPDLELGLQDWPRERGKSGLKERFTDLRGGRVVRKVRTGMTFVMTEEVRLAVGPCLANDNQVVNFVNAQLTTWLLHRGFTLCHAAAVTRGERGVVIAGMSAGGKSTLALRLLEPGTAFVSNDRVLIRATDTGAEMAGLPKLPRVNPGTLLAHDRLRSVLPESRQRELARLDEDALWTLEEKYDVDVGRLFDDVPFVLEAPMSALIVLNWQRDARMPTEMREVRLEERRDLLAAVTKSPGPFHLPTRDLLTHDGPYLEALRRVVTLEVVGGVDFEVARAGARRLLEP